jgi:hypothetical protein
LWKDLAEQAKAFVGPVKDLFNQVSIDLLSEMSNAAGLSPKNIEYCKRFYELYAGLAENQQVVDLRNMGGKGDFLENTLFSVPWGHHCVIIDKHV